MSNERQKILFQEVTEQWGFSTTALKNYLNEFYSEDISYAEKLGGINVNYLLPYRRNGFYYGRMALDRLELAMRAKAIIMGALGDIDDFQKYGYECLRLYLRINTMVKIGAHLVPVITYKDFEKQVKDIYWEYIEICNDKDRFDKYIEEIENKCEECRPKRKKTKYHYTADDFEDMKIIIKLEEFNRLEKAYHYWIENMYEKAKYKANKKGLDEPVKLTFESWKSYMKRFGITKEIHKKTGDKTQYVY